MLKHAGTASAAVLAFLGAPLCGAQQPYSSYWFPEELLSWSPDTDPDAAFNRGSVPLAGRFAGAPVNPNAMPEPKVVAISIMNPSTSANPSQGSDKFHVYAFGYWQYVDLLVMWGGSAGEGLILSPSADVIDAAHKNGVPVLGTVFFPPTVYGGQLQWVQQFVQQNPDGSFPVADKLVEVAQYYGFDGWFINQETPANTTVANQMRAFLKYLQAIKPEGMHIQWYDAMRNNGTVGWQGQLNGNNDMFLQEGNQRVSDSMFIDFRWRNSTTSLPNSHNRALSLGRSPYDLYAGIDVQANGYNTSFSTTQWNRIFPPGQTPRTSVGFYCPDWTYHSSATQEEFLAKENRFWVGANGDPRDTTTTHSWKGLAHYVIEKSPITALPFITHFNTGNGQFFAIDGETVRTRPWNQRGLQDVLPTWRWICDSPGEPLRPSIDWTTAYYGGSSLKVEGSLIPGNPTHLVLYKTALEIEPGTEVTVVYKTPFAQSNFQLGLAIAEFDDEFVFLPAGESHRTKWNRKSFDLKAFQGLTISALSFLFESPMAVEDYQVNIGGIAITADSVNNRSLRAPSNLRIDTVSFRDGIYADTRLQWNPVAPEAQLYHVFRVNPDRQLELLGSTANHAYYVSPFRRIGMEDVTTLRVVPVNQRYKAGRAADISFQWPPYPRPTAAFAPSKTLVAPGTEIQFFDFSSEVTEEWFWHLPGGTPETSTEPNPIVRYDVEGTYDVVLIARNSVGDDVRHEVGLITVSDLANQVANVALNKPTTASSFVNANEAPPFAVDGRTNTKWCAVGQPPHWWRVDLGGDFVISEFVILHAEAGNESPSMNTRDFQLHVSDDGNSWTVAADVVGNSWGVTSHPIRVTQARYVRLWVSTPTQGGDTAARIYEVQVYGIPAEAW